MGFWLVKGSLSNLESGRFKGIRELPWDILDSLEGSDVVHKLKEKELLEFECKSFQIRQVGVNGDSFDLMLAGTCHQCLVLKLIEPRSLLNPMMGFGSGRSFLGFESPSKIGLLGLNVCRWCLLGGRFGKFGETLVEPRISGDQMGSPVSLCNGLYARLLLMGKSNGDLSVESRETTEEEEYGVFPVMERRRTRSGVAKIDEANDEIYNCNSEKIHIANRLKAKMAVRVVSACFN
ncbi:hypothetical protein YC2023_040943 [Brassica napus]